MVRATVAKSSKHAILIYFLGSIGDTVVALPAFHLIARTFKPATLVLLTNMPREREAPSASLLREAGLIDDTIAYCLGERSPAALWNLRRAIRRLGADRLIYLMRPRGRAKAFRDYLFFRACSVPEVTGVPLRKALQEWMPGQTGAPYESETHRLGRCLSELGDLQLGDPASWDLRLNKADHGTASESLRCLSGRPFLAAAPGSKIAAKDWGEANWRIWADTLTRSMPGVALVLIGGSEDAARSAVVADAWNGPKLNLCGMLSPRQSAAVLVRARCFIGHDSGPMHLAACVGTPCVALFGSQQPLGVWYPCGNGHHIVHNAELGRIEAAPVVAATVTLFEQDARVRFDQPIMSSS